MSSDTKQYGHWIIDGAFADVGENQYNNLLRNSIDSIITENKNKLSIKDTFLRTGKGFTFRNVPKININTLPKSNNYMSNSQSWVGHIIDIREDDFTAKLEDKNNPTTYELAEFDIEDVSPGDLDLLKTGAIFYWSVGYAYQESQIEKKSILRFKRSVDISTKEFNIISNNVDSLLNKINWD